MPFKLLYFVLILVPSLVFLFLVLSLNKITHKLRPQHIAVLMYTQLHRYKNCL